jgi:colanic acid biosynthesis glycosyl transferase WcaI
VRILFLTENFPPEVNAAATRVYERAVYWVKWGHEVTVLTSAPNFPEGRLFPGYANRWRQRENVDGIEVIRVKTFMTANQGVVLRTLDFMSFMVSAFVQGIFAKRPDIVVATSPQFFAAVGGWAIADVRRLPFVFELGDLWPRSIIAVGALPDSRAMRALEWLELFLYRRSARIVALTETFKHDLVRRGIASEKIEVVINGVDLPRYQPRPRDAALAAEWGLTGKFTVGYVGTHGMAHDLGNAVTAADLLTDAAFLFVGAGAERDRLVERARSVPNVTFAPRQPKERMPAVWSLCDVALVHLKDSPAFGEVIPSKIFEAMGMGLPILLVAPDGEARRIVEEDGAGLWVPPGNPPALADAVRRLRDDPELRCRLARASLAAAPRHTRETQARRFLDALEKALSAPSRGGVQMPSSSSSASRSRYRP